MPVDIFPLEVRIDEYQPDTSSLAIVDTAAFILDDFGNLDDIDIVETSSEGELEAIETTRVAMENLMVEVNELDCEKSVITLGSNGNPRPQ